MTPKQQHEEYPPLDHDYDAAEGDFPDDVSALDDMASVFSYTTNSTQTTEYTSGDQSFSKKEYVDPKVAVKEQRWVFWSKMLVAGVLLTAMTAMATATFWLIQQGEYDDFVVQVSFRELESGCKRVLSVAMYLLSNSDSDCGLHAVYSDR